MERLFLLPLSLSLALCVGLVLGVDEVGAERAADSPPATPAPASPGCNPAETPRTEEDLELLYQLLWVEPGEEPFDLSLV